MASMEDMAVKRLAEYSGLLGPSLRMANRKGRGTATPRLLASLLQSQESQSVYKWNDEQDSLAPRSPIGAGLEA